VREWSVDSGKNVTTIDAFSIGMAGAIKNISVVEGRLWCGRTDGSVTVFDASTASAVAHLKLHKGLIGTVAPVHSCVWVTAGAEVAVLNHAGTIQSRFSLPPSHEASHNSFLAAACPHTVYASGESPVVWVLANGSPIVLPVGWNNRQASERSPSYVDLGGRPVEGSHATCLVFVPGSVTEGGQDQIWVGRSGGSGGWKPELGEKGCERLRLLSASGESLHTGTVNPNPNPNRTVTRTVNPNPTTGINLPCGVTCLDIRRDKVWCGLENGSVAIISTRSLQVTESIVSMAYMDVITV